MHSPRGSPVCIAYVYAHTATSEEYLSKAVPVDSLADLTGIKDLSRAGEHSTLPVDKVMSYVKDVRGCMLSSVRWKRSGEG